MSVTAYVPHVSGILVFLLGVLPRYYRTFHSFLREVFECLTDMSSSVRDFRRPGGIWRTSYYCVGHPGLLVASRHVAS
ncbi:hypothetical protein EDB87DRAFT_1667942 [Lactarius vividus]|nr:hypothetical protein EDB87DRAFT_1667942 [Lactarius vividus]